MYNLTQLHFRKHSTLKNLSSFVLLTSLSLGLISCATTSSQSQQQAQATVAETVLVEDRLVAFGLPTQAQPDIQEHHIVMAGAKNSYVITDGGIQFLKLISQLDTLNLHIDKNLKFISPENDGHFNADFNINYVNSIDELSKKELLFLYQNDAKNCTSANDASMNAMRFCINVKLTGEVYPAATNLKDLKVDLSRFGQAYHMTVLSHSPSTQSPILQLRPDAQSFALKPFEFADSSK